MTGAVLAGTATTRDLLFPDCRGDSAEALARSLHRKRTLSARFPGCATLVERAVATEIDQLLSEHLDDMSVAGWKKFDLLMQAARRTRDAGTEEDVALADHRIDSSHRPTIVVLVNGDSTAVFQIDLRITLTLSGVDVVVHRGWLTTVACDRCEVSGYLALRQHVVAERGQEFDLPGAIRLRRGVPLVRPAVENTRPRPLSVRPD